MSEFDESYYKSGNYINYLSRLGRYTAMAKEIDEFLKMICLSKKEKNILDWGCGPGLLCKSFESIGYQNVYGFDISQWAINYAKETYNVNVTNEWSNDTLGRSYHLTLSLDVFEHIPLSNLRAALDEIRTDYMIARIPVAAVDDGELLCPIAQTDATHCTRLTKETWEQLFDVHSFELIGRLNLITMYDSDVKLVGLYKRA